MTKKSAKWFPLISVFIGISIALIIVEVVLSSLKTQLSESGELEDGLFRYHHQLGWAMTPLWHGRQTHLDYNVTYQIDRDGFRYTPKQKNKSDILVLGDSFTFGVGVADSDTFVNQLNRDSLHGWKNLAVAGYSTDQELLLLENSTIKNIKSVILVVYLGNDLADNLLNSPLQADFSKPYFKLENNQLVLKNQPVSLKPQSDKKINFNTLVFKPQPPHFYDRFALTQWIKATNLFKADFSATQLTTKFINGMTLFEKIIQRMQQFSEKNKMKLNIVLLSGSSVITRPNSKSAQLQQWIAQQIKQMTEKMQLPMLDLSIGLAQYQDEAPLYFKNEGHLTPKGHYMVANLIKTFLKSSL